MLMKKVLLFLFVSFIGMKSWGQLFQQQFSTDLSSFSNSSVTTGTYANSSPSNAQFTALYSSGGLQFRLRLVN